MSTAVANPLRVAMVMPPPTALHAADALGCWPTVSGALSALAGSGEGGASAVIPALFGRGRGHVDRPHEVWLEPSAVAVARRVAEWRPDVVHIHGLGFARQTLAIARRSAAPIVLQHHGEPPPSTAKARLAAAAAGRHVAGLLFTGAQWGQAEPFRRGPLRATPVFEVLEGASDLIAGSDLAPRLAGDPAVLWVGRLIDGKDPLTAVRAVAAAAPRRPGIHLHVLVTDDALQAAVLAEAARLGVGGRLTVHPAQPHPEMQRWYRAADVYLSTSRREGSNYSLIEAVGFGCRPVVTSIPSHRAIVGEGRATFAPGDPDAAAALLAAPPERSRADVIADATARLSWPAIAEQLLQAYRAVARA